MWKTKIKNYSLENCMICDFVYIRIVLYVYDIGVRKNNDLEEEIKLVKCSRAGLHRTCDVFPRGEEYFL